MQIRGAIAVGTVFLCGCLPPAELVLDQPQAARPPANAPTAAPPAKELTLADLEWPLEAAKLAEPIRADVAAWLRDKAQPYKEQKGIRRPKLGPEDAALIPAFLAAIDAPRRGELATMKRLGLTTRKAFWDHPLHMPVANVANSLRDAGRDGLCPIGPAALTALAGALRGDGGMGAAMMFQYFGKEGTPPLLEALAEPATRRAAIYGLYWNNDHAAPAIDPLLAVVRAPEEPYRGKAAQAIGRIGAPAKRAVPALLGELRATGDSDFRWYLIRALVDLGAATPEVVNAIAACHDDPGRATRQAVFEAFWKLGARTEGAWGAIAAGLTDSERTVRSAAASAAAKLAPPPGDQLAALAASLKGDIHDWTQARVLQAVELTGPKAATLLPLVRRHLASEHAFVRESALRAIAFVEPDRAKRLEAFLPALADRESARTAAEMLAWEGAGAAPALPALRECLRERRGHRDFTLEAIRAMGAAALPGVPDLLAEWRREETQSSEPRRNRLVIDALVAVGAAAIPALVEDLRRHPDKTAADAALARMGAPGAEALLQLLSDPALRVDAAWALRGCGPRAVAGMPVFLEMAQSPKAAERHAALKALQSLGARAEGAVPVLLQMLTPRYTLPGNLFDDREAPAPKNDWEEWRSGGGMHSGPANAAEMWEVIRTLAAIGSAARGPLERKLEEERAKNEKHGHLRYTLEEGVKDFGKLAPPVPQTLAQLTGRLQRDPSAIREHDGIMPALRAMGPAAAPAMPLFLKLAATGDYHEPRDAWVRLFEAIGPGAKAALPMLWRSYRKRSGDWKRLIVARAIRSIEGR